IAQQVALGIDVFLLSLLEAGAFLLLIETVKIADFKAITADRFEALAFFHPFNWVEVDTGFDSGDDLFGSRSIRLMLNRKLTHKLADLLACLLSGCRDGVTRRAAVGAPDRRQCLTLTAAVSEVARNEFTFCVGLTVARIAQLAGRREEFTVATTICRAGCQIGFGAWWQRVVSIPVQCHHLQSIETRLMGLAFQPIEGIQRI